MTRPPDSRSRCDSVRVLKETEKNYEICKLNSAIRYGKLHFLKDENRAMMHKQRIIKSKYIFKKEKYFDATNRDILHQTQMN